MVLTVDFWWCWLLTVTGAGGYPAYSPLLAATRPPPASFSHFPGGMLYWPACGYPSPPISPNNYYMAGGHLATPSSLLTPTSSISNLSNGLTSPGQDQASPTQPQQPGQNSLVRLTSVVWTTWRPGGRPGHPGRPHQHQVQLRWEWWQGDSKLDIYL